MRGIFQMKLKQEELGRDFSSFVSSSSK